MLRAKEPKRGGGGKSSKGGRNKKTVGMYDHSGLRDLTKKRYLNDIFQWCADQCDSWMVLIVDKKSMRALSSSLGMYDIMEKRITLVEDIERIRAPFTDQGAIYLLAPTEDSVDRLIADWDTSKTNKKPLYGDSVFLFFLGKISDKCIEKIKACRPLVKRVKCLTEANIDYLAKELRGFHFDMRKSFHDIYLRKGRNKIEGRMAEKLISICSTLNEYPHIRYANSSPAATVLAKSLDLKLNQFLQNPDFWFHGDAQHNDRERATLIILDRKDDCLTPLMHDFHYQSMVNDVLHVKEDMITLVNNSVEDYEEFEDDDEEDDHENKKPKGQGGAVSKNAKDILLNENDSVWCELRGKHIAEVITTLSERCQEMVASDTSGLAGRSGGGGSSMTLTQMASALKALPEYQQVMEKLSHHMQIAHQCMDKLNTLGLMELSEIEQTLATGKTEEGTTPQTPELMGLVIQKLNTLGDSKARFRLLMLTIVSQNGVKEDFKQALWEASEVTKEQEKVLDVMANVLDIPLVNRSEDKKGIKKLFGNKKKSTAESDSEYANTRYVPPLKYILEDLVNHSLSITDYPATRNLPESHASGSSGVQKRTAGSARPKNTAASRWTRTKKSSAKEDSNESYQGGRFIIFVIGGLAFAELRVARDIMKKESKEVIAGSTNFISPVEFIDDIRRLAKHNKKDTQDNEEVAADPTEKKTRKKHRKKSKDHS
mmetsp:Transcript_31839/g.36230  ORF Transcript_31839/g.36230 Transcript_31839/m.36230 type:complete len:713 (-) Transcript_31839:184-2322(-)|eukprot:CAMPEP_0194137408 /NCGR_PEP_ID=MMETSP0152-20130528/7317_1 /TAXON_ID=1049557 /ORGANISM="Thalassiothrix antarctica, Strain L6-D1" /LENGTH=712 /DNA_ID=CAMNT_0038834427 /DNA_START=161 /DNA_END=2299 /DNA_ORIENTATION=+